MVWLEIKPNGRKIAPNVQTPLSSMEPGMSQHDHHAVHHEPDPRDSTADAIAAFCALAIAVTGILYFISQQ